MVLDELQKRSADLRLSAVSKEESEIYDKPDTIVLFCIIVDQYSRKISNNFPVFIYQGDTIEMVRETI